MAIESRFKQEKEQAFVYEHIQDVGLVYVCRHIIQSGILLP
ncbi:hypothetical protein OK016_27635 [Vibrio chagasii]|nr:hypothetical protein [Vibrio chagasii]